MKGCSRVLTLALLLLGLAGGSASSLMGSAAQAQETSQDMLAAQIRSQGIACGKPLGAVRDPKRSKPDHEVWVLKCDNATYRVSRYPDMAAKVEQLH